MRLATFAALLAVIGCDDTKSSGPDKNVKQDTPVQADKGKAPAQTPTGDKFDNAAFCAQVFDKKSVEAILGLEFPPLVEPDRTERINFKRGGFALCKYKQKPDENLFKHQQRQKWVSAEVDCRKRRLSLEDWEKQAKLYATKKDDAYVEIDVGKGGGYLRMMEAHQLLFIHGTVECTIHVTLVNVEEDKTEALARHVDGKLTAASRPPPYIDN